MTETFERKKEEEDCAQDQVFFIRVQFRHNSSMQGTVTWLNRNKSRFFRSTLELGHLLHDAYASFSEGEKK